MVPGLWPLARASAANSCFQASYPPELLPHWAAPAWPATASSASDAATVTVWNCLPLVIQSSSRAVRRPPVEYSCGGSQAPTAPSPRLTPVPSLSGILEAGLPHFALPRLFQVCEYLGGGPERRIAPHLTHDRRG